MPKNDIVTKINSLIEASEGNTLNANAFQEMLPSDMDEGEVDEIMEYLTAQGVELVEDDTEEDAVLTVTPSKTKNRDELVPRSVTGASDEVEMTDAVKLYLQEIGQTPLLTREQEIEQIGRASCRERV